VSGKLPWISAVCINAPHSSFGDPEGGVLGVNEYNGERLARSGSLASAGNRLDGDLIQEDSAVAAIR
jgi:hypothetical protein